MLEFSYSVIGKQLFVLVDAREIYKYRIKKVKYQKWKCAEEIQFVKVEARRRVDISEKKYI